MSRNIDIVTLRSFASVVKAGGVSKAADELNLTQSAISQHIKRLESMLDISLFSRSGRALVLTSSGEALLEYASKLLDTNDNIITHFSKETKEECVAIGLSEHISHIYLPKILSTCSALSDIRLDVKIGFNQALFDDLGNGALDIALLVSEQGTHNYKTIDQCCAAWVSSADLEFAATDELPIILYGGPCMFRTMMISTLEAHNIPWRVVYNASSIGDLKAALEAKMGFSVLLDCEIDGRLTASAYNRLPSLPMLDVTLHSRDNPQSQAIASVLNEINVHLMN